MDLKPGDCDAFLIGVLRRNWKKLAEPMWRFDEEVVRDIMRMPGLKGRIEATGKQW